MREHPPDIVFFGNIDVSHNTAEIHTRHKINTMRIRTSNPLRISDTITRVRMHKQQHSKSRYQRRQMKWRAKWWRMVFSPARQIIEQFKAGWRRGAWD